MKWYVGFILGSLWLACADGAYSSRYKPYRSYKGNEDHYSNSRYSSYNPYKKPSPTYGYSKYEKEEPNYSRYSTYKESPPSYGYSKYEKEEPNYSRYSTYKESPPSYGYSKYEKEGPYIDSRPSYEKYEGSSKYNSKYNTYGSSYKYEEPETYSRYKSDNYKRKENYETPKYEVQYKHPDKLCCNLESTKIEVVVLDSDCEPIEGACVSVADSSNVKDYKTNSKGIVAFTTDCCKVHFIVTASGYMMESREVYLDDDEICTTYKKRVVFLLEPKCTYRAWIYGISLQLNGTSPGLAAYQYSCGNSYDGYHIGAGEVVVSGGGCLMYHDFDVASVCLGGCQYGDDVMVKVSIQGAEMTSKVEVSGDLIGYDQGVAVNVPLLSNVTMLDYNSLVISINMWYYEHDNEEEGEDDPGTPPYCMVYLEKVFVLEEYGSLHLIHYDLDETHIVLDMSYYSGNLLVYATLESYDCDCDGEHHLDYYEDIKGSITVTNSECKMKTFEAGPVSYVDTKVFLLACICGGTDVYQVIAPNYLTHDDYYNYPPTFDYYCNCPSDK